MASPKSFSSSGLTGSKTRAAVAYAQIPAWAVRTMKALENGKAVAVVLTAGVLVAGACFAACGGGSNNNGPSNGGADGGGGGSDAGAGEGGSSVNTQPGSCANPTLQLAFSPMYSAFIPGASDHTFPDSGGHR